MDIPEWTHEFYPRCDNPPENTGANVAEQRASLYHMLLKRVLDLPYRRVKAGYQCPMCGQIALTVEGLDFAHGGNSCLFDYIFRALAADPDTIRAMIEELGEHAE